MASTLRERFVDRANRVGERFLRWLDAYFARHSLVGDKTFFPDALACDPVNRHYMRKFFDLTAEHGIPVYWLLPPISAELQARTYHESQNKPTYAIREIRQTAAVAAADKSLTAQR